MHTDTETTAPPPRVANLAIEDGAAKEKDVEATGEHRVVQVQADAVDDSSNECGIPVNLLRKIFQEYLGPALVQPVGQIAVVITFSLLLGFGIFGATKIKEDSDFRDFMPAGSYVIDYINKDEEYFVTVGERVSVYTSKIDYPSSHTALEALRAAAVACPYVVPDTVSSWEQNFHTYQVNVLGGPAANAAAWYSRFNTYLAGPGAKFRSDIKFLDNDAAGSETNYIAAARFNMNHKFCENSKCEVSSMHGLRDSVKAATPSAGGSPAPFPFSSLYLNWEQYAAIEEEAHRNIGLAFLAILIIAVLLIPHLVVSLLVFLSVVMTIVEVVGYMYFWDMKVDGVTVVMLIVALGLAIDYSAHIGVAYLHSQKTTQAEAVVQALTDMGTPVCHGAMSTLLAIIVLAPSKSFVFISFFKQLLLATVLGCAHGMLFLPVMLSIFGPRPSPVAVKAKPQSETVVGVKAVQMEQQSQNTTEAPVNENQESFESKDEAPGAAEMAGSDSKPGQDGRDCCPGTPKT